jgi:hypothetical protein
MEAGWSRGMMRWEGGSDCARRATGRNSAPGSVDRCGSRGLPPLPPLPPGPRRSRCQAEPAPSVPSAKKSVALGTKHAVSAVATTGSAGIKAYHGGVDPELLEKERQEKASLLSEVTELKLKIDTAERERDFYFDKLRQIEIMCQAPELADEKVLRVVESVLYAADAEEARKIMVEAEGTLGVHLVPEEEGGVGGDVAGDVGNHVEAVEAFLTSE